MTIDKEQLRAVFNPALDATRNFLGFFHADKVMVVGKILDVCSVLLADDGTMDSFAALINKIIAGGATPESVQVAMAEMRGDNAGEANVA